MSTDFSSVDEAFYYLESFTNLEKKTTLYEREYRLDRVKYLFAAFESPHEGINLIHIAGSKGKGSTASYAASILENCGFKTGLYTSPHLLTYRERITHSGKFFSDNIYIKSISLIKNFLEKNILPFETPPTTFELLTLLAFLIFRQQMCSWAVIETGIGGRLDATNIITPLCSVITPLELEHQEILGSLIEEIALEKAGIIKNSVDAVTARQPDAALEVLKNAAAEKGSRLTVLSDAMQISNIAVSLGGTSFTLSSDCEEGFEYTPETSLLGSFQAENSALAVLAVIKAVSKAVEKCRDCPKVELYQGELCSGVFYHEKLFAKNFFLHDFFAEAVKKGIREAKAPGRIEYIRPCGSLPGIILDSSHTPGSASKLRTVLEEVCKHEKMVLLFGSIEGKNYKKILQILAPLFSEIIISTPGVFKKSSPEMSYNYLKQQVIDKKVSLETIPASALARASESAGKKGLIVVTGSFYMSGEIIKILKGGYCGISAQ
ncbi:MAG: Mur ligase family protein [Spirochaetia bacterium]|jgi:dihydrofolate synthase/folylpolyglutamate synthase|nr:Mur ligase family protein [Spirochaetia bacterium]